MVVSMVHVATPGNHSTCTADKEFAAWVKRQTDGNAGFPDTVKNVNLKVPASGAGRKRKAEAEAAAAVTAAQAMAAATMVLARHYN